ncbi:hypothetical protein [Roseivirga misakiensis]|uniref:Uncharacterized protein n=1 Tax=Roseivirga misakiensis TaxID=1563681 RepID=A0A1E5T5A6_9BACT|nr:hypothetical protein [Roseivirga misakiensis]OEK06565.1 hypothetical protein BFP71_02520 [Roseivirga misakiensis]
MRLNKSKSLYVSVLMTFLLIAFIDYQDSKSDQLTYSLHPVQKTEVLVASNATENINQKQQLNETDHNYSSLMLPCR